MKKLLHHRAHILLLVAFGPQAPRWLPPQQAFKGVQRKAGFAAETGGGTQSCHLYMRACTGAWLGLQCADPAKNIRNGTFNAFATQTVRER